MLKQVDNSKLETMLSIYKQKRQTLLSRYEKIVVKGANDIENIALRKRIGKTTRTYAAMINTINIKMDPSRNHVYGDNKRRMSSFNRLMKDGVAHDGLELYRMVGKLERVELNINELPKFENYHRMKVFIHKGLKCSHPDCKRIGSRLFLTTDSEGKIHLDIYTDDMKMMTNDHIIPKSKGGSNELSNLQPMCDTHNFRKSNKLVPY